MRLMAQKRRYQAFAYTGGSTMPGKGYVYDFQTGGVARDAGGKLIWTPTVAEAKRVAARLNGGGNG